MWVFGRGCYDFGARRASGTPAIQTWMVGIGGLMSGCPVLIRRELGDVKYPKLLKH